MVSDVIYIAAIVSSVALGAWVAKGNLALGPRAMDILGITLIVVVIGSYIGRRE